MKTICFSLLLALTVLLNAPLHAAPPGSVGISQQEAVSLVQKKYPGRVLKVKRTDNVYRVKTLNANGEIRIIIVDANSGKIISGR